MSDLRTIALSDLIAEETAKRDAAEAAETVARFAGDARTAQHEIDQWGAFYRVETITKTDAKRLLAEGLHRVIKRLKKGE